MKKKKLTNRERDELADGLGKNQQILYNKILQMDSLWGLYLEYKKEADKFSKFVKDKVEEFEKQQQSENKEGA